MAFAQIDFFSEYLRMQCCMNVILPQKINGYGVLPDKKATPPYPVLYLLHGTSQNHTDWMRFSSIERYVAKTGLVVVMPSTLRAWYTNQKLGYPFFDFFTKELPLLVKSFFNVSDKREDTFAAGLSMGGFGAFKLGLTYPERFAAVASLSGSVDMCMVAEGSKYRSEKAKMYRYITFGSQEDMYGSETDTVGLAEQHLKNGTQLPKFYQCCGTEDWLLPVNRAFRDRFMGRLDLTYEEGPGGHKWDFWDKYIQKVIEWLPIQR